MAQESTDTIDIIGAGDAGTLPGLFHRRAGRSPQACAYREFRGGRWTEFSWSEMAARVGRFRAHLERLGFKRGDRAAVLLANGTDWVVFDIAAMTSGLITVPLYAHDSPQAVAFILKDSGARLLFTDNEERWAAIAPHLEHCDTLEHVWLRDGAHAGRKKQASGPQVVAYAEAGDDVPASEGAPACGSGDVATIVYTSGTTGRPKGVMLTHEALLWNAEAVTKFIPPLRSDIFLSLLPLAHTFERTMGYYLAVMCGATVAYARSIETLREDLRVIRPTILIAVPRLYERIHDGILKKAPGGLKKMFMARAADIGWRLFEARHGRGARPGVFERFVLWPLLRRLVAAPVLEAFGRRLRVAVSGGAPLTEDVSHFLIGLGLPLVEGYGLTEASPVVTATTLEDNLPGSVGRPLDGLEVRIGEGGELLVRSPSLMKGYWKAPDATRETITADGWLKTGDVAEIRDGRVYIVGRLKDLIVLSTGKNVGPGEIEATIRADPLFEQVCVVGDRRPCLAAVATLNADAWAAFCRENGLDPKNPDDVTARRAVLGKIDDLTVHLPAYAKVRGVHLVLSPWTVEDGILTPTLKVKRHVVDKRYEKEIGKLYADLSGAAKTATA
ncbi:long-chain fatty acid--CoA ligase [Rhizobiales bacterium]|uniref:AMP-dependent synthetase/ligase n=1 Tax=Hongsoonwoonella zoysiae TaxID=2821844 RepID=UPI0015608E20|nr:long-chain fatty acid--CoA ligase [Hongsoonwoonella zoysiae]NRG17912.1 long-chain fatty acid--CoA ligase [Hongsoonwoonella zoysiae]